MHLQSVGIQFILWRSVYCCGIMQMQKVLKLPQYVAMLALILHCFEVMADNNSSNMSLQKAIEHQLEMEQSYDHLLKRKRRYLEFPQGSSFQLVYDLIVGVVDFTNYLILGVTVALAWELPSKPPSEILDDLTNRLKDGTLGTTRNDTIENIKYVDTNTTTRTKIKRPSLQPLFRPPMHVQYYTNKEPDQYYRYQNVSPKKTWLRKGNSYYSYKSLQPFIKWKQNTRTSGAAKYPWWHLKSRLPTFSKSPHPIQGSRRFDQNFRKLKGNRSYQSTGRSEHKIFPIFGKRSINDTYNRRRRSSPNSGTFSKWDHIHIRHHRNTRHELYKRIESYLTGRGSNGHHCVLRALCETGQKSGERTPGSFVGEIMRAIFTLPEAPEDNAELHGSDIKQQRYDKANAATGSCSLRYHLCKDSLWSSHYVM